MFPLYSKPSSIIGWGHGGWGVGNMLYVLPVCILPGECPTSSRWSSWPQQQRDPLLCLDDEDLNPGHTVCTQHCWSLVIKNVNPSTLFDSNIHPSLEALVHSRNSRIPGNGKFSFPIPGNDQAYTGMDSQLSVHFFRLSCKLSHRDSAYCASRLLLSRWEQPQTSVQLFLHSAGTWEPDWLDC